MNGSLDDRRLLEAVSFSARAHRYQLRKDGETPYGAHPFRVCLIVRQLFGFDDPRMLIAALLHDTIEDTTTDFDDLAERFSPEIAAWVSLLTKDKRLADAERERAYLEQLRSAPWQVQVCKLADVFDNLVDLRTIPEGRRQHGVQRAEQYLAVLGDVETPEVQEPLRMVQQQLRQARTAFAARND
jgi:guanosine-3',5'-bis(diphosphate) 3'-pyrophosphohydrolase